MRVVSVIGIAGIGKSRLAWEVEQRAGDAAARARWHVGRAPAYGEGTAFAPLADMVRRSAGIAESDPAELVRRALAETLGAAPPRRSRARMDGAATAGAARAERDPGGTARGALRGVAPLL